MGGGEEHGREGGGEGVRGKETLGVEFFVHDFVILLEPFFTFFRCAAELAILGWRISLCFLA